MDTIKYKGFTITIYNDSDLSDIYWSDIKEGADGSIVYVYGNRDYYKSDDDLILERIRKQFKDKGNKRNIDSYYWYNILTSDERKELKKYGHDEYNGVIENAEVLGLEYEKALMKIMDKLKIKYIWYESRGYSQGDYIKVILVENDGFVHDMEYIDACLWGGFVSYHIPEIDTCSGYPDTDEAIQDAKEAIDAHIKQVKERKTKRLKELVKHNVPLAQRQIILGQFDKF